MLIERFQTLNAVVAAVKRGQVVHWQNDGYVVSYSNGSPVVVWENSGDAVGLFHADGHTSDYNPDDFYSM